MADVPAEQSADRPAGEVPSPPPAAPGGDGAAKLAAVANTALVGVPAAYATTHSLPVTVITAVMALVFVFLGRRYR
ncbi:hypothetical protein ACIBQX_49065 [Nonomuraea sp. NPDC049714]|uniref:hypothetical protein n=1 Tax=Nonomuraea sp. NPDC049714 TaxID=3364357 RepID=UPI0037AB0333